MRKSARALLPGEGRDSVGTYMAVARFMWQGGVDPLRQAACPSAALENSRRRPRTLDCVGGWAGLCRPRPLPRCPWQADCCGRCAQSTAIGKLQARSEPDRRDSHSCVGEGSSRGALGLAGCGGDGMEEEEGHGADARRSKSGRSLMHRLAQVADAGRARARPRGAATPYLAAIALLLALIAFLRAGILQCKLMGEAASARCVLLGDARNRGNSSDAPQAKAKRSPAR